MTDLLRRFQAHLTRLGVPAGRALVGVSGGADSLALLDLLSRTAPETGLELTVLHVDHGIAPESADLAERVQATALRYRLPCLVERLALGPRASETRARRARYDRFHALLRQESVRTLFLAHQADDQAETVLMRLLAGSGPAGLAAMPARRGPFVRPLLPFTRAELARHLSNLGLDPWRDPANDDPRHLRAWLRHQILPRLLERVPEVRRNLGRTARLAGEERRAWQAALTRLPALDFRLESGVASVAALPLKGYSSTLRRTILRASARRVGVRVGEAALDRLEVLAVEGHTGQLVELSGGGRAERAFDRIRLFLDVAHPILRPVGLEGERGEVEFGRWRLSWVVDRAPPALERVGNTTWVAGGAPLRVRAWAPGDRIRPLGGRGSRLVVRCMQDVKIARSRRPFWPVVESDGLVLWVPAVCRSDARVPVSNGESLRIDACAV